MKTEHEHPSKDPSTLHVVKCLKGLPPKYHRSNEDLKMCAWVEMSEALTRMSSAETIEDLERRKKVSEHGYASAILLKDEFKDAAERTTSSIANEVRSKRRKEQQEQTRQCCRKFDAEMLRVVCRC